MSVRTVTVETCLTHKGVNSRFTSAVQCIEYWNTFCVISALSTPHTFAQNKRFDKSHRNNVSIQRAFRLTTLQKFMHLVRLMWGSASESTPGPQPLSRLSQEWRKAELIQNQLEWFSFECRKTKTKVITLANHIGHRQYIEPIKTRRNYMGLTQSAGKCTRARHIWLWFYFWLDEKVARIF